MRGSSIFCFSRRSSSHRSSWVEHTLHAAHMGGHSTSEVQGDWRTITVAAMSLEAWNWIQSSTQISSCPMSYQTAKETGASRHVCAVKLLVPTFSSEVRVLGLATRLHVCGGASGV